MSSLIPFNDVEVSQTNGNTDNNDVIISIVWIDIFETAFLNILVIYFVLFFD